MDFLSWLSAAAFNAVIFSFCMGFDDSEVGTGSQRVRVVAGVPDELLRFLRPKVSAEELESALSLNVSFQLNASFCKVYCSNTAAGETEEQLRYW
jgi:hypothetical protein